MSKAHICDRCGKVYSTKDVEVTNSSITTWSPTSIQNWHTGDKGWTISNTKELCADCSYSYHKFMKGSILHDEYLMNKAREEAGYNNE